MKPNNLRSLAVAALLLGLVGCAPARVALKPSFWKDNPHRVGVATVAPPQLAAYKAGSQGLLDMAINSAMAGSLEEHLQRLDVSGFSTVADQYVKKLNERGINARRLAQTVAPLTFPEFTSSSSDEFAERDLRTLAGKEDLDMLILLSVQQCGTQRAYYGFIPLGPPQALCVSKGELIDLKTNQILWRTYQNNEQALQSVAGEWDEPPHFSNVTVAINQSLIQSQKFLVGEFFGPNGGRFEQPTSALVTFKGASSPAAPTADAR
jgi:hypothetical protein